MQNFTLIKKDGSKMDVEAKDYAAAESRAKKIGARVYSVEVKTKKVKKNARNEEE